MSNSEIIKGEWWERVFTFLDENVASDPNVVKFGVETPAGTETVYEFGVGTTVSKIGTGQYKVRLQFDGEVGAHRWTMGATWSSPAGVVQVQGVVQVAPAYVDVV